MMIRSAAYHAVANGAVKGMAVKEVMMTAIELANREQLSASNPQVSAFVAASAGSGKTKLLTDRLLRLMLTGTPPDKILCLTYTKAAAAEMAIRLNRKLGGWVVMADRELDTELAKLDMPATATSRSRARQLFADVLDLPGGMRINTIHAFCQSLLRRFPLEAQLSPHFKLEDDFEATSRLREARETQLTNPDQRDNIAALAEETNELDFAELVARLAGEGEFQTLMQQFSHAAVTAMQRAALNAPDISLEALALAGVNLPRETQLASVLRRIATVGNPSGVKWANRCLDWLADNHQARQANWAEWVDAHFTATNGRRSFHGFFGKNPANECDAWVVEIDAERTRIETIEETRLAINLASFNAHLLNLVAPILQTHGAQKIEHATLTYTDLISITLNLFKQPENVAWILYKLDGGIDHLLLDEVQDTAPAQWQIASAIAGEFFAGIGARDVQRSIFAVGDPKQSIFSFQGADLESFQTYRAALRTQAKAAGQNWLDGQLSVSFRSTAPVLALVDAVFAKAPACHGVCEPGSLRHEVSRTGQDGGTTLWPLSKPTVTAALPPWEVPDDYAQTQSATAMLAGQIASYIKNALNTRLMLPSRERPAMAGDFLILVRRRDALVNAITRACKAADIPIAGLDRMVLPEQQAVSDLLALCDALLLPSDDLAFGQFLVSPLGGLSDESLMALALGRRTSLAAALFARRDERPEWAAADAFFQTLLRQVDFIAPYSLLAQALGPLGGRAKLLQRLGAEAGEPIDEMLAEAQTHARNNPASLQHFVVWLRQTGATIKREAEASGGMVRIMTVHGAKGLQAPIVILPDTTAIPKPKDTLFQLPVPQQNLQVPVFCPRTALRSGAITRAAAASKQRQMAEYNRLLYVALTRAEDELIICGAEGRKALPEECWYNLVKTGFTALRASAGTVGEWSYRAAQTAKPDREEKRELMSAAPLPAWAGMAPDWQALPPGLETTRPEPLVPSRSADDPAKRATAASPLGNGMAALRLSQQSALAKGRLVHALLQHLPDMAPGARSTACQTYLAQPGLALSVALQHQILTSVMTILQAPGLQALFAPGSKAEVPLAGVVDDVEIGGLVDRLAVQDNAILLADYKTDRLPPTNPAAVPPAYLRQLAAYQAVLEQIFPAKRISCLLIWTETATIMALPPTLLVRHAPGHLQPPETSQGA
ncbi:MAG: double-strand break repair helicase AddA [Acidocella sp.]|nr:double-strand break repair helicase AddA [Acidocella sp.]